MEEALTDEVVNDRFFSKTNVGNTIIGALFDVSGSMKNKLRLHNAKDYILDEDTNRASVIFTTLVDIIKDIDECNNNKVQLFSCAFGLDNQKVSKCDLLQLLEYKVKSMEIHDLDLFVELYFPEKLGIEDVQKYIQRQDHDGAFIVVGYEPLIELLKVNGAPYVSEHIMTQLDIFKSGNLFMQLSANSKCIPQVISKLPPECKNYADHLKVKAKMTTPALSKGSGIGAGISVIGAGIGVGVGGIFTPIIAGAVALGMSPFVALSLPILAGVTIGGGIIHTTYNSANKLETRIKEEHHEAVEEGVKLTEDIVKEFKDNIASYIEQLQTYSLQETQDLVYQYCEGETAKKRKEKKISYKPTTEKIERLVEAIEPYIYGGTPMVDALKAATEMYQKNTDQNQVLFLLSDGESSDGNPVPLCEQLQRSGVRILCCFLSESTNSPRQLHHESLPDWTKPQVDMFKMSSIVTTNLPAISFLRRQGWDIPDKGTCRLFLTANDPKVIKEFSEIVNKVMLSNDCLFDMLARISLDVYVFDEYASLKSEKQIGETCYAHAIATVYHLVMFRIKERTGGVPKFEHIKKDLIEEYEGKKAHTKKVMEETCPRYRLHPHFFLKDEYEARQAINELQPVVAIFRLSDENWGIFKKFFLNNPTGKLSASVLKGQEGVKTHGHAVVLTRCHGNTLRFMNSWGPSWGNGGFFTVESSAIDFEFIGVTPKLLPSEEQFVEMEKKRVAREIVGMMPEKAEELNYACPKCLMVSQIKEFNGNIFNAKCPKCLVEFKPTLWGLMERLYMQNR